MGYAASLTISADTAETSPSKYIFPFYPMMVNEVALTFPSGCVGLVGVWFEYQSAQLWPYNTDGRFIGNDEIIRFRPGIRLDEAPYELTLKGYNEDDTFDHTIYAVLDVSFGKGVLAEIQRLLGGQSALPGR